LNIPDLIFENLAKFFGLKILKLFDADAVPGSGIMWIQDPRLKKWDPG
jgi:hypothetical protein